MGQTNKTSTIDVTCTEESIEQLINIFPIDVWRYILGNSNDHGLHISEYRNQLFVCKGFMHAAKLSVSSLDLIELSRISPYRKCTLVSHIIREGVLKIFPNLKTLHISFSDLNIFELHEKLTDEYYKGKSLKEKTDVDDKLTEFENDVEKLVAEHNELIKNPPKKFGMKDAFKIIGILVEGVWSSLRIIQNTSMPFSPETRYEKSGELYPLLEKIIVNECICNLNLNKLYLHTCFDISLLFVAKMQNLRTLSISVNASRYSKRDAVVYLSSNVFATGKKVHDVLPEQNRTVLCSEAISSSRLREELIDQNEINKTETNNDNLPTHNLEGLEIGVNTQFTASFEELAAVFPNIKTLSVNTNTPYENAVQYFGQEKPNTIGSLVLNFPQIEKLTITNNTNEYEYSYMCGVMQLNKQFDPLCKLSKLRKLDVSTINISPIDLISISTIPNLRELVISDRNDTTFGAMVHTCDPYQNAIKTFRLTRPDVNIMLIAYEK
jgi:hypothetical protein